MMPRPVRLFHITAIDNLDAICRAGALLSKNKGALNGINYQNIAHAGAQGRRVAKSVLNPPGGNMHDYVPFYFAPRSPMLFAINGGKVAGCSYDQTDILHFETTIRNIHAVNQHLVFYDRNATLDYSIAYSDLNKLSTEIAWDLFTEAPRLDGFCQYFHSISGHPRYSERMEYRQAEFLVKNSVDLDLITRIGVCNDDKAVQINGILAKNGINLSVEIIPEWYF